MPAMTAKMKPVENLANNNQASPSDQHDRARLGVIYGLAAYFVWGFFPVFFKALEGASPLEIVCHRIFWSVVFLFVLVTLRRQLGKIINTLHDRFTLLILCGSTLLIATNWLVFIYAVQQGEVLQSSLGYFITPLISVLLGFRLFTGEVEPMAGIQCSARPGRSLEPGLPSQPVPLDRSHPCNHLRPLRTAA